MQEIARQAAVAAAKEVTSRRDRGIVIRTAVVVLVVVLLVAVPIAVVVDHQRTSGALDNSRFNCGLLTETAEAHEAFVSSDAQLRRQQQTLGERVEVKAGLNRIFGAAVVKRLTDESKALDRDAQRYWLDLAARLRALARVNCDALHRSGPGRTPSVLTTPTPMPPRSLRPLRTRGE